MECGDVRMPQTLPIVSPSRFELLCMIQARSAVCETLAWRGRRLIGDSGETGKH